MQTQEQATPSVAAIEIPKSGTPEYAEWRVSGELPEKPKAADPAPASSEPPKAKIAPGPEPGKKQQERRKPDAEARIQELTARAKQLERDLEEARRPKQTQAESSPAKPPQTYAEWRKGFKPAEWVTQYSKDNPQASYEDANAAMADHLADVRDQFRTSEDRQRKEQQELNQKVSEGRERYGAKFDELVWPTLRTIAESQAVSSPAKAMINDSEVVTDLLYVLAPEVDAFIAMAPGKQIRHLAKLESLIVEELSSGKASGNGRNDKGQFTPETPPAKRGPESAPAPPLEIGSRGSGALDESDRALQAIERGDPAATRAFMRAENQKDLRRRRGV